MWQERDGGGRRVSSLLEEDTQIEGILGEEIEVTLWWWFRRSDSCAPQGL